MAKKHGRPLKYTPVELKQIIDKYFDETPRKEHTITGLAMRVGSKQLLQDYQKRPDYEPMITYAKLRVENAYELSLRQFGRTGDIFALKNLGWKDKIDIPNTALFKECKIMIVNQVKGKEDEVSVDGLPATIPEAISL